MICHCAGRPRILRISQTTVAVSSEWDDSLGQEGLLPLYASYARGVPWLAKKVLVKVMWSDS